MTSPALQFTNTDVPYQFYGYSIQQTVMVLKLLCSNNADAYISIELLDDLFYQSINESNAIQIKSAMNNNPVTNSNINLWKTLSNWIDLIKVNKINIDKTYFELFLTRKKSGPIVDAMNNCQNSEQATKVFNLAIEHFKDRNKVAEGIRPYVCNFIRFYYKNKEKFDKLLINFSLDYPTDTILLSIHDKLRLRGIPEEYIENITTWLLGWTKKKTDTLLESHSPTCINTTDFNDALFNHSIAVTNRNILRSFASKPNKNDIDDELNSLNTYIQQLYIIKADNILTIEAVSDYLMAAHDRTKWAEIGLVDENDYFDFENDIVRKWNNQKRQLDITASGNSDIEKGNLLYLNCLEYRTRIQHLEIPNHFIPGSYHLLSDSGIIGWHPNYKKLLKINEED